MSRHRIRKPGYRKRIWWREIIVQFGVDFRFLGLLRASTEYEGALWALDSLAKILNWNLDRLLAFWAPEFFSRILHARNREKTVAKADAQYSTVIKAAVIQAKRF